MKRDGMDKEEALRRMRSQMPIEEKRAYADYIIDNRGTLETTQSQVVRVWEELKHIT
jgi:dephospho-CoA kinase